MHATPTPSSSSFPPQCPTVTVPPTKIAPGTWVVHQVQPALGAPLAIYLNSMVILGSEPVLVDTGTPANRAQWLEDVFTLVEPEDVRWIYLSHDDVDHTGNLDEALTACPNATVVCNWAMVERHTNCFEFPLHRCRWVMDGESYMGGRIAVSVRSPASKLSPSLSQRQRSIGNSNALVCRSCIGQLITSVAFGHASIVSSRLPVWSTSSCER